jgi:hypothetical protein
VALIYLYFVLAVLVAIMASIRGRSAWRWFLIALFITPLISGLLVMALPQQPRISGSCDDLGLASAADATLAPADCTIRVIRLSGYLDRRSAYEIFVNGARIGIITHDSVVDFNVPCGTLLIEARSGWGGSRPLTVNVAPEHSAEIEVSNRWGPLLAIWAVTFRRGSYLTVRELPTAHVGQRAS